MGHEISRWMLRKRGEGGQGGRTPEARVMSRMSGCIYDMDHSILFPK